MISLRDSSFPASGELTGEVEGRLCPVPPLHPAVHVAKDMSATRDEAVSLWSKAGLGADESLLKRASSAWWRKGALQAAHVLAEGGRSPRALERAAAALASALLAVCAPHRPSRPADRPSHPVKCLAWHPHVAKLAVATDDDVLRVYVAEQPPLVLKCAAQKRIKDVHWRPNSASELAVACDDCVVVWTVDPSSTFAKPSPANASVFKFPGHSPLASLAWSPDGDVLVSASAADRSLRVWNPSGGEPCSIGRLAGGGLTRVLWSPDGSRLFSATTGVVFRIWDADAWQAERWSLDGGRVQAACWSPCSRTLLFATEQHPRVYQLNNGNTTPFAALKNLECATPVIDLTKVELEDGTIAGGRVLDLKWSPKGHHLAITFKESPLVAIFNTRITHTFTLQITPCCFVTGIEDEKANVICFQQNFSQGACLTIAWSSGRIQHFPIIYNQTIE